MSGRDLVPSSRSLCVHPFPFPSLPPFLSFLPPQPLFPLLLLALITSHIGGPLGGARGAYFFDCECLDAPPAQSRSSLPPSLPPLLSTFLFSYPSLSILGFYMSKVVFVLLILGLVMASVMVLILSTFLRFPQQYNSISDTIFRGNDWDLQIGIIDVYIFSVMRGFYG